MVAVDAHGCGACDYGVGYVHVHGDLQEEDKEEAPMSLEEKLRVK